VCACREHARKLALENEALHDQVRQTERDTVDVLGFLKNQDEQKDEQVGKSLFTEVDYYYVDFVKLKVYHHHYCFGLYPDHHRSCLMYAGLLLLKILNIW